LIVPFVASCTGAMANSEQLTQEWTLATAERGALVEVLAVGGGDPEPLLVQGIRPGANVSIEADAPFGGPRIVRVGGHRVAVDRRLARWVRVIPVGEGSGNPPAAGRCVPGPR
jgi:Fe2+ transport system protein FeoA